MKRRLFGASCPRSRRWNSRLTINYDDGTSETATSVTPCSRSGLCRQ